MKKIANESKLNIQIVEQDGGFATKIIVAALSFLISLSILNLAFVSLALQKAGFSMIAVAISLILITALEIALSRGDDNEVSGIKVGLKQYGVLIVVVLLLVATLAVHHDFGEGLRALMQRISVTMTEAQGGIHDNFIEGQASKLGVHFLTLMLGVAVFELVFLSIRKGAFYTFIALALAEICLAYAGIFTVSMSFAVSTVLLISGALLAGNSSMLKISGGRALISSIVATVLILLLALVPLTSSDILPLRAVSRTNDAIKSAMHRKIYGGTKLFARGNLSSIEEFEPNKRVQLDVTMSKAEPMYLRGFVGEYLDGNKWVNLTGTGLSDARDRFYWLRQNGVYGESLLARNNLEKNGKNNTGELSIKLVNADCQNLYLPYSFLQEKKAMYMDSRIGDSVIAANSKESKSYKLSYSKDSVKEAYVNQKKLGSIAQDKASTTYMESVYRDFVHKNYLDISAANKKTLKKILGDSKALSTSEAKLKIVEFMNKNLKYDESTSSSGENDELGYFLTNSKVGKSELYASAATQMLRYYGVPARYVEGYVITEKMIEDNSSGGKEAASKPASLTVTEENAHAWCEYYLDGVGWIPFDVAPKYRGEIKFTKTDDALKSELGGGKGSEGSSSDSSEKNEENKDTNQDIENPINSQSLVFTYAKLFVLLAVILVLIVLIIITAIRRYRLRRFLRSLKTCDARLAVKKSFSYSMYLVSQKIRDFDASFIKENAAEIRENFPNSADLLLEAIAVNDRAVYASDDEIISDDDRKTMLNFNESVSKEYAEGRSLPCRIFDKYIRVIY